MNLVIEMITKKFEEKVIFDGASFQFQKGRFMDYSAGMAQVRQLYLTVFLEIFHSTVVKFIWKRMADRI